VSKRKAHEKRVQQREHLKEASGAEDKIEEERQRQEREGTGRLAEEPQANHHEADLPPRPQH